MALFYYMPLTEVLSFIAGLAGLVAGVGAFLKSRGEADHSAVDAAGDAIALVRQVYEQRIEAMEKDIATLKLGREVDRRTIIELNQRLGNVMQAAEIQNQQIKLWRERVEELLCILRENGLPLPKWAQPGACDG